MDSLFTLVQQLEQNGLKFDVIVIRFMDAFSLVESSHSLLKAISFGYSTIANSIYFENKIIQISRQIVELEDFEIDPENMDVNIAVQCLSELKKSTTLASEDKIIIGEALQRIRGRSCFCVVL